MAMPRDTEFCWDSSPGYERFQEAGCKGRRRGERECVWRDTAVQSVDWDGHAGLCVPRDETEVIHLVQFIDSESEGASGSSPVPSSPAFV